MASRAREFAARMIPVVGWIGAGAALAARPLREFDLPWHLAYGRAIAGSHALPRTDDFAYTHTAVHYIGVLGDLLLFAVARAAGALGLQLLAGAIAVALALVLVASARPHVAAGVLATAIAIAGASPWLFARPATLTFLFVAILMLLVEAHRRDPGTRGARVLLIGTATLHVLWANVHGGAVLGVAVLALYAAYRIAAARFAERAPRWFPRGDATHAGVAGSALVLSALGALLQPWGLAYLEGPLEVGRYRAILGEWATTDLSFFTGTSPLAGAALMVLLLAIVAGGALPAFDLGVTLLAVGLATRVRFVPLAIVLLAPIAARRAGARVPDRLPLRLAAGAAALALGPALLVAHDTPPRVGFDPRYFPVQAVDFVERAAPRGRMWNFWPYGGYLIWRLYPRWRVLIDGRIGFVHDPETVAQIVDGAHDDRAFAALAARYDFEWAICRATGGERDCEPIARSKAWTMVYVDDTTAVYVRTHGDNAALAADGYHVLRHITPPELVILRAAAGGSFARDLAHDGDLAARQDPASARAWLLATCGAIAVRDQGAFAADMVHFAGLVPAGHPAIRALHAAALRVGIRD